MQRLIPFGTAYAESGEFTVDEGSTVVLWLVREDQTTTVGESEAEVLIKAEDGKFTTVLYLNDKTPMLRLGDSDDLVTYKVVRKAGRPSAAVDGSSTGALSQNITPAPVSQSVAGTECLLMSFIAATDPSGTYGVGFKNGGEEAPGYPTYGTLRTPPFSGGIKVLGGIKANSGQFKLVGPTASGIANYNGKVQLYTKAGVPLGGSFNRAASFEVSPGVTMSIWSFTGMAATPLVAGETYYLSFCPMGKTRTVVPNDSNRFRIDHNDFPARLSASGFNGAEAVKLFAVEGNVLIPVRYKNGTDADLTAGYPAYAIDAPGWYEWQRTPGSDIAVYLNTGWG